MSGQSCHVGLCQLDCLALDCGLTMAAEGAVPKHHMVMYMIYRSSTCSKDSSRGLFAHSWWPSLSRLVLPSILRGDWDQWNPSFLPRTDHKSKPSLCLEGSHCSAFRSKWFWRSDKWLWCNLPWWSIFERDTGTHGPNASNVSPSSSSLAVCSIRWTFRAWKTNWFPWESETVLGQVYIKDELTHVTHVGTTKVETPQLTPIIFQASDSPMCSSMFPPSKLQKIAEVPEHDAWSFPSFVHVLAAKMWLPFLFA